LIEIEDELRRVFADPRRTPSGWPDAAQRVRAGMRRRHRRAIAGTGSVTLLAILASVLAIAAVRESTHEEPTGPNPSASAVVPWRDLPSVGRAAPTLSPRPATVVCRSADLVLLSAETEGALGTLDVEVRVRNVGASRCTVTGRPTLIRSDAKTIPAGTNMMMPLEPNSTPATVDPGEEARIRIETYGGCLDGRRETVYSGVKLRMPDGGQFALHDPVNITCGINVGEWYRALPAGTTAEPFDGLKVSIQAPARVAAGTTLEYIVTLANPTGNDIVLDPCPDYSFTLTVPKKAGGFRQLNCAVPVIPAHGSVRFAMQLAVPPDNGFTGSATLSWALGFDGSPDQAPAASVPITVVS
jgi:hypothetical protein